MKDLKQFYSSHADRINDKRFNSEYKLRSYAHACQYNSILNQVEPGMRVLDAGCGEGTLSVMMAEKGAVVVGTDISEPNIEAAKEYGNKNEVEVDFRVADIENLPFADNEFDMVVSSHVLEHIPDFDAGLKEIMRVTKKRAVVAIPTVLNGCSLVQVGGGWFYIKGIRSFLALPLGLLYALGAFISRREGVDEEYAGAGVEHIFRFPRIMRQKISKYDFKLVYQEASTLTLPYFEFLLPLSKKLDTLKSKAFFRNLGYGTTYVIEKSQTE